MKKILFILLSFCLVLGIGCKKEEDPNKEKKELLDSILNGVVIDSSYKNLANDLMLPEIAGGKYLISWDINAEAADWAYIDINDDGVQIIRITQSEDEAKEFTLTASIRDGAVTASRTWTGYVRIATQAEEVTTQQAKEAKVNSYLQVTGVVTYVNGIKGFWVKDETGSLYIYVNAEFEAKVGDKVTVRGTKSVNYSLHELKDPTIVSTEAGSFNATQNAEDTDVAALADIVANYVKPGATDEYKAEVEFSYGNLYNVSGRLLENTNSAISYKYILQDDITGKFVNLYDSAMTTEVKNQLATLVGKYIKGTFMLWDMHSQGYGRFLPIGAVEETAVPTLNDAQKVAAAKSEIELLLANDIVTDVNLFATSTLGATVVWISSNENFLTKEGKIGASTNATEKVTLTAVITCGTETATVEKEVTVKFPEPITVKQVVEACDAGKSIVCFKGKVVATDIDGYFYVADSTGVIYVRTKLETVDGLAVNDYVKVVGETSVYDNSGKQYTRQINAKQIVEITEQITVMEATQVTLADFAAVTATDGVISDTSLAAFKADTKGYAIVTFEAYVTIRGSYGNAYFSVANDDSSAAVLYYHKSADQEGVKAFAGKLVTVTCVIYDIQGTDGWRLGSCLSIVEKTA